MCFARVSLDDKGITFPNKGNICKIRKKILRRQLADMTEILKYNSKYFENKTTKFSNMHRNI